MSTRGAWRAPIDITAEAALRKPDRVDPGGAWRTAIDTLARSRPLASRSCRRGGAHGALRSTPSPEGGPSQVDRVDPRGRIGHSDRHHRPQPPLASRSCQPMGRIAHPDRHHRQQPPLASRSSQPRGRMAPRSTPSPAAAPCQPIMSTRGAHSAPRSTPSPAAAPHKPIMSTQGAHGALRSTSRPQPHPASRSCRLVAVMSHRALVAAAVRGARSRGRTRAARGWRCRAAA